MNLAEKYKLQWKVSAGKTLIIIGDFRVFYLLPRVGVYTSLYLILKIIVKKLYDQDFLTPVASLEI